MPPIFAAIVVAGAASLLRSSDLKHVQVGMPWHFSEGRRSCLLRRRILFIGFVYRRAHKVGADAAENSPVFAGRVASTGVPSAGTGIAQHTAVSPLTTMAMMVVLLMMVVMVAVMA